MLQPRTLSVSMLLLLAVPACDADEPSDAPSGAVDFGASGKADGEGPLAVLGDFSSNLNELPTAAVPSCNFFTDALASS